VTSRQDMLDNATPVRIIKAPEELDTLGVEFGSTNTFPVPLIGTAAPVQLLQRRPTRFKAVISVDSLATAGQSTITGANPGAGANFVYTNNTGQSQTILTASALFTADAVVANRFVSYQMKNAAGQNIAFGQDGNAVLASTNVTLNAGVGYAQVNSATGNSFVPIPAGIVIPPGGTFTFAASNIDAGDTWTTILLTFAGASSGGVLLAYRPDYLANPNNPQGYLIAAAPRIFQWENQQPLYAVALGSGPVNVGIIDQAQSAAQAVAEEATEGEDFPDEQYQEEDPRYAGTRNANQY